MSAGHFSRVPACPRLVALAETLLDAEAGHDGAAKAQGAVEVGHADEDMREHTHSLRSGAEASTLRGRPVDRLDCPAPLNRPRIAPCPRRLPPPPSPATPCRPNARGDRHRAGRAVRLDRPGAAHLAALFQPRPEHRLQPPAPARDAVGPREGRGPVPLHAARRAPRRAVTIRLSVTSQSAYPRISRRRTRRLRAETVITLTTCRSVHAVLARSRMAVSRLKKRWCVPP